jgi:hypothetical protein
MLYASPVSAVRSAPASAICSSASTSAHPKIISSVVIVVMLILVGQIWVVHPVHRHRIANLLH